MEDPFVPTSILEQIFFLEVSKAVSSTHFLLVGESNVGPTESCESHLPIWWDPHEIHLIMKSLQKEVCIGIFLWSMVNHQMVQSYI